MKSKEDIVAETRKAVEGNPGTIKWILSFVPYYCSKVRWVAEDNGGAPLDVMRAGRGSGYEVLMTFVWLAKDADGEVCEVVALRHTDGVNGTHVVLVGDTRRVIDPAHRVVYRAKKGRVLTFDEVCADPTLADHADPVWKSPINGVGMSGFYVNATP